MADMDWYGLPDEEKKKRSSAMANLPGVNSIDTRQGFNEMRPLSETPGINSIRPTIYNSTPPPPARTVLNEPAATAPAPQRNSFNRPKVARDVNTGPTSHEEVPQYGFRSGQDVQVIRGMENIPLDSNMQDMRTPEERTQGEITKAQYTRDKLLAPAPLPFTYQDWNLISSKEKEMRMGQYNAEQAHNMTLAAEITRDTLGLSGGLSKDATDLQRERMSNESAQKVEDIRGRYGVQQQGISAGASKYNADLLHDSRLAVSEVTNAANIEKAKILAESKKDDFETGGVKPKGIPWKHPNGKTYYRLTDGTWQDEQGNPVKVNK